MKINKTKMRLGIILICLAFMGNTFGQKKEFKFAPKWKVGDKKSVVIQQHETDYKNNIIELDTTIIIFAEMAILKENNNDYILKITYENIAWRSAVKFYDKLSTDLPKYKNLDLVFRINKQSGKSELINWKEAKKFMNQSLDQINSVLKKNVPEMASMAELAFMPIRMMFDNKKNMEDFIKSEVGYLLFPYDKKYLAGDTLTTIEMCANPFNPEDTISQTTYSYLTNIDESKKNM